MKKEKTRRASMSTSLRTIAEACDVSLNTVSNILNRKLDHLYKADTIEKIRRVAAERGYRPNLAAKMLLSNSSNMIGLVAWKLAGDGTIANPVIYPFLIGASDYLATQGYHIVVVGIDEMKDKNPQSVPDPLEQHFFDSLILQQGRWENIRDWEKKSRVPIVSWDSGVFDDFNSVWRNELEVGRLLTQRLIALGHRRIAFSWYEGNWESYQSLQETLKNGTGEPSIHANDIRNHRNISSDLLHYSSVHRYEGYLSVMEEHNLPHMELFLGPIPAIADQVLVLRPTAVIVQGVGNIFSIEHAARRIGLQMPQDISVASCDIEARIPFSAEISIGGITYDRYETGRRSAEMCLKLLRNPGSTEPSIKVLGEFRIGDTISYARQ